MTAIDKRYWRWNAQDSVYSIKLGDSIEDLLRKALIHKIEGKDDEYRGNGGVPYSIKEKNRLVDSIFFREIFFDLLEDEIWGYEVKEFTQKLDAVLEPIEDSIVGPRLRVVFRGGFVAIAGIEIK